jgi:hypothetical protein
MSPPSAKRSDSWSLPTIATADANLLCIQLPMSKSTATFSVQDIRAALSAHEQTLANYRDSMALEQVARTRRWLDEGDQRELFAEAAEDLEQGFTQANSASPDLWATVGGYRHLAGESKQARHALGKAIAKGTDWEPAPQGPAGVAYLLGNYDLAQRLAPTDPVGWIAAAARERDLEPVHRARGRWTEWQRLEKSGPQHDRNPVPLSAWDWIEETYRLEAELRGEAPPAHLEMLRRSGLLRSVDEPAAPTHRRPPPRTGFVAELEQGARRRPDSKSSTRTSSRSSSSLSACSTCAATTPPKAGASASRTASAQGSGSSPPANLTSRARPAGRRTGWSFEASPRPVSSSAAW